MRGNLETRVAALEAQSDSSVNQLMVVGPYAEHSDPEPYLAAARERWRERFGDYPDGNVRVLRIVLCGMKPITGGASDALQ